MGRSDQDSGMTQSAAELHPSRVSAFRLSRHHLDGQGAAQAARVALDVGGIQAQVMSAAELALRARSQHLSRDDIQAALWEERSLIKTVSMRGTLHLLPTAEFPVYVSALRRSRLRIMGQIMARYGVTRKEADLVNRTVLELLADGPLSRPELTERILARCRVGKKARAWFEQSWWGVTREAMVVGKVCYGPDQGRNVTLMLVDDWLPRQDPVPEEDARRAFLRRYLSAYGPASAKDFSKWAGITVPEARATCRLLKDELIRVRWDHRRGWLLQQDLEVLRQIPVKRQSVRLLGHFDSYLLGHADTDHLVDTARYKRVYRNAGWISPVVLRNGRVIGVWSQKRRAQRILLEIEPFERLSQRIRSMIRKEAESLGKFLYGNCIIEYLQS